MRTSHLDTIFHTGHSAHTGHPVEVDALLFERVAVVARERELRVECTLSLPLSIHLVDQRHVLAQHHGALLQPESDALV